MSKLEVTEIMENLSALAGDYDVTYYIEKLLDITDGVRADCEKLIVADVQDHHLFQITTATKAAAQHIYTVIELISKIKVMSSRLLEAEKKRATEDVYRAADVVAKAIEDTTCVF